MRYSRKAYTIALSALLAIVGCSDNYYKELKGSHYADTHECFVGDKILKFIVTRESIENSAEWEPGQPLPISIADAVAIAVIEITKYDENVDKWHLTGIRLHRHSTNKWYYVVDYDKPNDYKTATSYSGCISIPVLFSGNAIVAQ